MNRDAWFNNAIIEGLQKLVTLRLENTPPMETIQLTASTWQEILWPKKRWHQQIHQRRIESAFTQMMGNINKWPAPKDLLDYMPKGEGQHMLPKPPPSQEEKRRGQQVIGNLLKNLNTPS